MFNLSRATSSVRRERLQYPSVELAGLPLKLCPCDMLDRLDIYVALIAEPPNSRQGHFVRSASKLTSYLNHTAKGHTAIRIWNGNDHAIPELAVITEVNDPHFTWLRAWHCPACHSPFRPTTLIGVRPTPELQPQGFPPGGGKV